MSSPSRYVALPHAQESLAELYAQLDELVLSDDEDGVGTSAGAAQQAAASDAAASPERLAPRHLSVGSEHKYGTRKAFLTIIKSFVATGVMFLPGSFRNAGLLAAVLTISLVGALSLYGMNLLILTRTHLEGRVVVDAGSALVGAPGSGAGEVTTFAQVGKSAFGTWGRRLVDTSILFSQFGFCCVYICFVGNTLSRAVASFGFVGPPLWVYMVLTVPVIAPLALIRHLKSFAWPNLVATAVICVSLVYVSAVAAAAIADPARAGARDWSCGADRAQSACLVVDARTYPLFLGSACYVFEGITMIMPVRNSMRAPETLPRLLGIAMGVCTALFLVFGTVNLLAYAQDTRPIIISNLPRTGALIITLGFVLVAVFMFPLMAFPAAHIVEKKLFGKIRHSGYKWHKNAIRVGIVVGCVAVSVLAGEKVDKLVALIGGLFCVPLAMVYPPLFYLKVGAATDFWRHKVPAALTMVFGCCATLLSTIVAVRTFNDEA